MNNIIPIPDVLRSYLEDITVNDREDQLTFAVDQFKFDLINRSTGMRLILDHGGSFISIGAKESDLVSNPDKLITMIKRALGYTYVTVDVECKYCGKVVPLTMKRMQLNAYNEGKKLVTQIFPNESADFREILITQMCSDCWNRIMKPNKRSKK